MKRRLYVIVISLVNLVLLSGVSSAGILSLTVSYPDEAVNGTYHSAEASFSNAKGTIDLSEEFSTVLDDCVQVAGETDGDPDFVITKKVKNKTTYNWTGYTVVVSGEGTSIVDDSVSSLGFSSWTYDDSTAVYSGGVIHPGEYVTLYLTVNIAEDVESYSFGLTQSIQAVPVPEPSSIILGVLGIAGALGVVIARRR